MRDRIREHQTQKEVTCMAAGKKRKPQDDTYMYDNLVRLRQTRTDENTDEHEIEGKSVSPQTRKNQRRAMKLGFGYVTFLAGAVAAALFVCFHYLGVQADLDKQTRKIESLRTEISSLKEKNTSEYNYIANSVNLEEIRERAEELGMVYADSSQIVEYQSAGNHEIRQYESIPEDGEASDK